MFMLLKYSHPHPTLLHNEFTLLKKLGALHYNDDDDDEEGMFCKVFSRRTIIKIHRCRCKTQMNSGEAQEGEKRW
jgi:hypothetical protein